MSSGIERLDRPLELIAVALLCWASPPVASGQPAAAAEGTDDHSQHHHHVAAGPQAVKSGVEAEDLRQIPDLQLLDQDGEEVRFYSDLVAG